MNKLSPMRQRILDYVTAHNIHVVTNNGMAVTKKLSNKTISVSLTGGELRDHVMTGEAVMRFLLNCTADKTFLGCAGVTPASHKNALAAMTMCQIDIF